MGWPCSSQKSRRFILLLTIPNCFSSPPSCSNIIEPCQQYLLNISLVFLFQLILVATAIFWVLIICKTSWSSRVVLAPLYSILFREQGNLHKCRFVCVIAMLITIWGRSNSYRINVRIYCNKCLLLLVLLFSCWLQFTTSYTPTTQNEAKCTTYIIAS